MPDRATVTYTYDGSFEGALCCIFESFLRKELPMDIAPEYDAAPTLYTQRYIETDMARAARVDRGVAEKMGPRAEGMLRTGFLYGEGGREAAMLDFVQFGLTEGFGRTAGMVDRPEVAPLFGMCRAVGNEAHLLKGFTRFTDRDGALVAVITPKHFVLPLLRGHFAMRYRNETFMIFDRTHGAALVHSGGKTVIAPVENVEIPEDAAMGDPVYSRLWKEYYKNTAIMERYNPKCRMTHMPKRFWPNMLEVEEEAGGWRAAGGELLTAGKF